MPALVGPVSMSERIAELRQKRSNLNRAWSRLNFTATIYLELSQFIGENWPESLRPTTIDIWLQSVESYANFIRGISDSVAWLNGADQLVDEGRAQYRISETRPGDLDLFGSPEDFPPMPLRLTEAFAGATPQSTTLGAEPLTTGTVFLIAIGIIGATASVVTIALAVREQTITRRAEIRATLTNATLRAVESGAISETFGQRILQTIDLWTKAEEIKPILKVDTGGVLTVVALGGAAYGVYRLLTHIGKKKKKKKRR